MKYIWISLLTFLLCTQSSFAQSGLFIAPNNSPITSPVTGRSWLFNSTNNTIAVWNGSSFQVVNAPFSNYTATSNPTSSNDGTQGYVVGSVWLNQTTQNIYTCFVNTASAAVWVLTNAPPSIPLANLQQNGATNGQGIVWSSSSGQWQPGTLSAGTVTSIGTNNGITGGTITTSGTIGLAGIAQNTVLGSVSSGTTTPVALTATQLTTIPNLANTTLKGLVPALTDAQIVVGKTSSSAQAVAMSGDVTITDTGVTTVGKIGGTAFTLPASVANGGTGTTNLTLIDSSSNLSINWDGRSLYQTDGSTISVDWVNDRLHDASGAFSINWNGRLLQDPTGQDAIDWAGRVLYANDGSTAVLNYSDPSGATSITQTSSDNSTNVATTAYVQSQFPLTATKGGTGTTLLSTGTATFSSANSVSVADTSITADSIIMVTQGGNGSALSEEFDVEVNAGTGFTIYSTNSSSTAIVNYFRVK